MPRHTITIDDYTLREFQELLADLRFTSLKAANLSTNVALAFLTGIPHISRNQDMSNNMPLDPDMVGERGSAARDVALLDTDQYIEMEDDRQERQIAADEAALQQSLAAPRYAEEYRGFVVTKKLKTKLRYWRERLSAAWERCRRRNIDDIDALDRHHAGNEEDAIKPKKKFNISYAELIIPSQDTYNPDFLHVPLHYGLLKSNSGIKPGSGGALPIIYDEDAGEHYAIGSGTPQDVSPLWEVNNRFRLSNEWLHPTLSLTKLSRIKLMLFLAPRNVQYLDPSTVFSAWILFERLVIKGAVTKSNRKLYAATCLILSYKFNQDGEQVVINEILAYLCRDRSITARAIFSNEMKVFTLLEFSLKQSYSGMRKHVNHYLEFNRITFMDLYETPESTYLSLENSENKEC